MRGSLLFAASCATLSGLFLVSGCDASKGTTGTDPAPPSATKDVTPGSGPPNSTAPRSSETATKPSPGELSYEDAKKLGLLRTDAVSVTGPSEVSGARQGVQVAVLVVLPSRLADNRIEVVWSGDCVLAERAKQAQFDIAAGQKKVVATVSARLSRAAETCDLRADAAFPNKPYTGDGVTVTLRR